MTESEFIRRAQAWVAQHTGIEGVDPDQDLVETGVLDSLLMVELFYLIEELAGTDIPVDDTSVEHIATLRGAFVVLERTAATT